MKVVHRDIHVRLDHLKKDNLKKFLSCVRRSLHFSVYYSIVLPPHMQRQQMNLSNLIIVTMEVVESNYYDTLEQIIWINYVQHELVIIFNLKSPNANK